MTKLEVINSMLATLGELPVNELDARHPYVSSGLRILDQKSKTIQLNSGAGWWFNKLELYTLRKDVAGKVFVPEDLIQYTALLYPDRYGKVNGYLWDNLNDTDVIGADVEVSAVRMLSFEDLPTAANDLAAFESILSFSRDYEGDMQKVAEIKLDVAMARLALKSQNIREQRANTQRNPHVAQAMSRFSRSPVLPRSF